jgi:hypothetical protein
MVYLLTAVGLPPGDNTQNNTLKQNTQNETHITRRLRNVQNQTEANKIYNLMYNHTK